MESVFFIHYIAESLQKAFPRLHELTPVAGWDPRNPEPGSQNTAACLTHARSLLLPLSFLLCPSYSMGLAFVRQAAVCSGNRAPDSLVGSHNLGKVFLRFFLGSASRILKHFDDTYLCTVWPASPCKVLVRFYLLTLHLFQ